MALLEFIILMFNLCGILCKIVLIESPSNSFGLENQKIVIRCHYRGGTDTSIKWFKGKSDAQLNVPERKVHTEQQADGSTISFLTIQLARHTEGEYYCNATDASGWVQSQKADVRIAFLEEQFVVEPQDKTVSVGETVLLECRPPKGLPKPSVRWSKDNMTVNVDERTQILENGNLRIDRIVWKDSGLYTCIAESFAFHRQSSAAVLNVRQRPYFVSSPLSQSVPIHSSFELSCSAAGEPLPVIVWRREPPFLEIPFERTKLLAKGALQFNRVQIEDAGDYVCRAISSAGVIEAIAQVNVVSPPGLVRTPPSSITVLEGTRVELPCKALGSPTPDVRWMRHSPEEYLIADTGNSVDRMIVTPSGTLLIYAARPDDSSTYECRASSPAGLTRSVTELNVQPNPSLEPARIGAYSVGRIVLPPSAQSKTVRIICEFPNVSLSNEIPHSDPGKSITASNDKVSILWLVDGKSLRTRFSRANKTYIEADGSLLIKDFELNDEANYTCTVFNHVSRRYSTWNFELLVDTNAKDSEYNLLRPSELPSSPASFTVTGIGDTWMTFQWSDNVEDSTSIPVYKLYYLPVVSSQSKTSSRKLDSSGEDANDGQGKLSPKSDVWLSTPDIVRHKQTRLSNLLPNTGYWVEIRKVNRKGVSAGQMYPKIVYTLKKPNTAVFINLKNDSFSFDQRTDRTHSLVSSNTAVDYQELSSSFQSISFSDLKVRSLTATEILTSWTTRSTGNILHQIDGFRLNIKPVPMTRCLMTATSGSLDQLSSFPYQDRSKTPLELDGVTSTSDSYMSPVHCSLSSDGLMQQIVRMSAAVANYASGHSEQSVRSPEAQAVIVGRSVSSINPTTKAVGGGLLPFTCYEVDVEAFRDDIVYGRLWSRTSRSALALTLDSSPSYSPHLLNAQWLFDVIGPGNVSIAERPAAKFNVVRLAWKPLELRMAHGALIGYVIHFLANNTDQSRTVHVPADAVTRDIFGLSPHMEYTIYMAGVTCRGEGVRGAGFRLPPAISLWRKTHTVALSESNTNLSSSSYFPTWAYGIIVGIVLFWVLIGLLTPFLLRRSSHKNRVVRGPDGVIPYSTRNKTGSASQVQSSRLALLSWHWCVWGDSMRSNRTGEEKSHSSVNCLATKGNEGGLDYVVAPALSENPVEMTTLLQRPGDTQTSSTPSERTPKDGHDRLLEHRYGRFSKAYRSQSIPRLSTDSSRSDKQPASVVSPGDNAEVYANSDPSNTSYPHSPSLKNTTPAASLVPNGHANMPCSTTCSRPQLPDSINIPFPLPPAYQPNGLMTAMCEPSNTITNANLMGEYMDSAYAHGAQPLSFSSSHGLMQDDVVPPYASCTVLPVSKPTFSGPGPRTAIGATLQRGSAYTANSFANSSVDPIGMSQSMASSAGFAQEDPNCTDLRTDAIPLPHRWPMRSEGAQVLAAGNHYLSVPNSPHSIPPPPEYPPPPLPAGPNDWMNSESRQFLPTHSATVSFSGTCNFDHEDQRMRFVTGAERPLPGSDHSQTYYASGGIYAQTEEAIPLIPYTLTNNSSQPSPFNAQAVNHFRHLDANYGPPTMMVCQNLQASAYGGNQPVPDRSQPTLNHRSNRSHSSGMRSGEGSSSGRSTTSGLGSGSTKFTNGGRLVDVSIACAPIGCGSLSGSDSSSTSAPRIGPRQQLAPSTLLTASGKQPVIHSTQSTPPPVISTTSGTRRFTGNGIAVNGEAKPSYSSNCTGRPSQPYHSTVASYPNYPPSVAGREPATSLIVCNPGAAGSHVPDRMYQLNDGSST